MGQRDQLWLKEGRESLYLRVVFICLHGSCMLDFAADFWKQAAPRQREGSEGTLGRLWGLILSPDLFKPCSGERFAASVWGCSSHSSALHPSPLAKQRILQIFSEYQRIYLSSPSLKVLALSYPSVEQREQTMARSWWQIPALLRACPSDR